MSLFLSPVARQLKIITPNFGVAFKDMTSSSPDGPVTSDAVGEVREVSETFLWLPYYTKLLH